MPNDSLSAKEEVHPADRHRIKFSSLPEACLGKPERLKNYGYGYCLSLILASSRIHILLYVTPIMLWSVSRPRPSMQASVTDLVLKQVQQAIILCHTGGGNAQKSATARAKNLEKHAPKKGELPCILVMPIPWYPSCACTLDAPIAANRPARSHAILIMMQAVRWLPMPMPCHLW